jgi:hypothetical protein
MGTTTFNRQVQAPSQPISSIKLDSDFYKGTRNTLTPENLQKLADFASTIPEPELFGTFKDEMHYKMTLQLMLGSTLETRHRGIFFRRIVLPALPQKNNLLDIGPGDGKLTSWIGNNFKTVTLLDPNKEIIDSLNMKSRLLKKYISIKKIERSILEAAIPDNHYNLILLSHILYYIPRSQWQATINKAYQATKIRGLTAIVLSGDHFGKDKLIRHFGGNSIDIDSLFKECSSLYGANNVKIFASKEVIITASFLAMLHIAGFFLNDAKVSTTKESLITYLRDNCQKNNGYYMMSTQQKFILIYK